MLCTCVFVAFFFLPFFSFFFFLRLLDVFGRRRKNLPAIFFSLLLLLLQKSSFPSQKKTRCSYYNPKKSFEANGARGRLDEEGSLNDTAGGLLRLLRRRRRLLFFPRRCFEGFLEGLPRVLEFSGDHARTFGEK